MPGTIFFFFSRMNFFFVTGDFSAVGQSGSKSNHPPSNFMLGRAVNARIYHTASASSNHKTASTENAILSCQDFHINIQILIQPQTQNTDLCVYFDTNLCVYFNTNLYIYTLIQIFVYTLIQIFIYIL